MDRKIFIKKTIGAGLFGAALPALLKSSTTEDTSETNEKNIEKVGYNHLPNKKEENMNSIIHRAETRGLADHGWLKSHHTFSFANYHNPERMNFGVLRVLNDDQVSGGKGFGTHPHKDMEIISIPLEGALEHQDSMGNVAVIKKGDVQVMSAGTGVYHSEKNQNSGEEVKFLQIWIIPNQQNVTPRYDQIPLATIAKENEFYQILSPTKNDQGVWIHQDAWFYIGTFDKDIKQDYSINKSGNGLYVFMLDGQATVDGNQLNPRDGMGIWDTSKITIEAAKNSRILLMEVPMQLK